MATLVTRSGKGSPLTHAEVDANFTNLNTDKLELSGGTMTGNLSFGDNDKAIFGAGSDLQIYHDGSNSYITDTGTGDLIIRGSNGIELKSNTENETLAYFAGNGAATLYYDNAAKLATTSTGIDVTGTVTADGLTVDGNATISSAAGSLYLEDNNYTAGQKVFGVTSKSGDLFLRSFTDDKLTATNRFGIDHSTGDISFYEDTGTTAKFFWDASAESLGIGTTSPSSLDATANDLVVGGGSGNKGLTIFSGTSSTGAVVFADGNDGTVAEYRGWMSYDHSTDALRFATASAERMRIDSSGNVGIGTSSPTDKLNITGGGASIEGSVSGFTGGEVLLGNTTANTQSAISTVATGTPQMYFDHRGTSTGQWVWRSSSSERMRIDSSGNLLVGKTSSSSNVVGTGLFPSGSATFCRDGAEVVYVNRKTSDGELIRLAKDGTTVGSIGTFNGDIIIGTGDTGLNFLDASGTIIPWNISSNTVRPDAIDLGTNYHRFKDLYLSGGVYLGGTGAANKLDDCEEGEYQVTVTASTSGSYTMRAGYTYYRYVKIGQVVHIQGMVSLSGASSPVGNPQINLPFTVGSGTNFSEWATGSALWYDDSGTVYTPKPILLTAGTTATVVMNAADLAAFDYIVVGFSYYTA